MKRVAFALLAWTAIVLAFTVIVGTSIETPACAHLIAPPPTCAGEIAAENARVWATQTLPMLVFAVAGYAVIIAIGLARARRRANPIAGAR